MLQQIFYSNAFCFSLARLYLGNSQVSVNRTIGPTLVSDFLVLPLQYVHFSSIVATFLRIEYMYNR